MALYVGSNKVKDTGEYGVYLGSQNTNCLTKTPKNINLEMVYGAWTQPVLTANGTWGGSSFATKTKNNNSAAYKAFDSSNTSYVGLNTGADNELYFYNPQPLKISKIDFTYYPSTWIINGELYGSNDDSNYVKLATIAHSANTGSITVNNTTGYKYFKIKAISANGSDGASKKITDFYHIAITATALNTLVLKKGSKVYVPNGVGKFDEVVTTNDFVINVGQPTGQRFLFAKVVNSASVGFFVGINENIFSGSSQPTPITDVAYWYDTTNNVIKRTQDKGATWTTYTGATLPLASVNFDTGVVTSINQVFDWCGYIGSTIFVVPNVEGLIPDGFNADGTYKSKKFKTTTVALATNPDKNDKLQYIHITDYGGIARDNIYHVSETQPTFGENSNQLWYNPKTNLMYYYRTTSNNGFKSWTLSGITFKGSSDSRISEFNIGYKAQPEMTVIPFNAIYNGSERVYQYLPGATTFNAGSNLSTYTVPKGCTKLGIDCVASKGFTGKADGGNGGRVTCDLSVTPGQTLYVTVGAIPTAAATASYNASDIRIGGTEYANRVIVAGGGGNGSSGSNAVSVNGTGGAGGGLTGGTGGTSNSAAGGAGGTQTEGGKYGGQGDYYGGSGASGTLGLGGAGASGGAGGNGGAGYYGGGGAAYGTYYDSWGGGGGGGSSYTSSACSNVVHTQGYQNGAGYIKITPKV